MFLSFLVFLRYANARELKRRAVFRVSSWVVFAFHCHSFDQKWNCNEFSRMIAIAELVYRLCVIRTIVLILIAFICRWSEWTWRTRTVSTPSPAAWPPAPRRRAATRPARPRRRPRCRPCPVSDRRTVPNSTPCPKMSKASAIRRCSAAMSSRRWCPVPAPPSARKTGTVVKIDLELSEHRVVSEKETPKRK